MSVGLAAAGAEAAPILIQPIIVCDNLGQNCAGGDPHPSDSVFKTLFNQSVLNTIYAQSAGTDYTGTQYPGVTFSILPASYYSNGAYLTTDIDSVTLGGTTVANVVDQAHQLLRDPNPAASSNPTTLNVYLVDQLVPTLNGVPTGAVSHGYGLTSSDGAILDVGAHIDSLAHEVGHNLGLTHVDVLNADGTETQSLQTGTDDLMQSQFRNTPTSVTDPAIGNTIDLLSGSQGNDQIKQVNQPLFTVDLASATLGDDPLYPNGSNPNAVACKFGDLNCGIFIASNPAKSNESLIEVKIRWLHQSDFESSPVDPPLHGIDAWSQVTIANGCDNVGVSQKILTPGVPDPAIELDVTYVPGCVTPGQVTSLSFQFDGNPEGDIYLPGYYNPPFSVEWDFSDGSTSVGRYDATTGNVTSQETTTATGIDTSGFSDFDDVDPQPVPEPGSSYILPALAALLALRACCSRRLRSAQEA